MRMQTESVDVNGSQHKKSWTALDILFPILASENDPMIVDPGALSR